MAAWTVMTTTLGAASRRSVPGIGASRSARVPAARPSVAGAAGAIGRVPRVPAGAAMAC